MEIKASGYRFHYKFPSIDIGEINPESIASHAPIMIPLQSTNI